MASLRHQWTDDERTSLSDAAHKPLESSGLAVKNEICHGNASIVGDQARNQLPQLAKGFGVAAIDLPEQAARDDVET